MLTFAHKNHHSKLASVVEASLTQTRYSKVMLAFAIASLLFLDGCGGSSSDSPNNLPLPTGRIVYVGRYNDLAGIMTMNPDGTGHKLLSNKFYNFLTHDVSFSPDGSKIVFTADDTPIYGAPFANNYDIWMMNSDGSDLKVLTSVNVEESENFSSPSFSPDGSKLIFTHSQNGKHTTLIRDIESGEQALVPMKENYSSAFFTPNGSRIAAYRHYENTSSVITMNMDGSEETLVVENATGLSFSRDGRRITFCRDREIYIANADGTRQRRLTNNDDWDDSPSFSPDGTRIVFNSDRDEPLAGDMSFGYHNLVIIMNADGTNQTTIPTDSQAKLVPEDWTINAYDRVSSHAWTSAPAQ